MPRFLPIITEMRLSLRSLSSFFCFSFCSFAASLAASFSAFSTSLTRFASDAESLLSPCKLLLELDPFNKEGIPKLNTDDFFCAEVGVDCEAEVESLLGEELALTRDCAEEEKVGDPASGITVDAGICIDCDDERRKNGIEEGVSRLCDCPRRTEELGLRGAGWGTASADVVWVLALDSVPALLGNGSGVLVGYCAGFADPTEDNDASEAADVMATDWMGDHESFGEAVDGDDSCWSFDNDFR